MLTRDLINFLKFTITWIASNLSIPFWVVGHVHLTVNIYEDIHEIIASFGMNIIVAIGFIIEYKTNTNNKR
jgi:hypothetical protein